MAESKEVIAERIDQLSDQQIDAAIDALRAKLDYRHGAFLSSCVHCGLCAEACHYYVAGDDPKLQPAYKVKLIQSIYQWHATSTGKLFSGLTGAHALDRETLHEWVDSLYGNCSMCGRCSLNCTVGIHIPRLVRAARSMLVSLNLVPTDLQSTVDLACDTGNNMGIPKAEWLDTAQWLEEELQGEMGEPTVRLPIDQENAKFLYTVNPREVKFFPLSLLATAKILSAAGESWTFSSDYYDVTNYGLFSGDDEAARLISSHLDDSMKKLKSEILILGECGHGFNANRWEAPEWMAATPSYETKSIIQIMAEYIRQGRIKLDRTRITKRVTLHDPCNLVRMGGMANEQRYILGEAVSDFVEMYPNREKNFCCGGGGGQLSMGTYAKRRLAAGKVKADQIAATGARIVVAPCHNCIDQLSELNKEYKLGVEIKTVSEIVAEALVLTPKA
jgi:Fe-S oxidoreductase